MEFKLSTECMSRNKDVKQAARTLLKEFKERFTENDLRRFAEELLNMDLYGAILYSKVECFGWTEPSLSFQVEQIIYSACSRVIHIRFYMEHDFTVCADPVTYYKYKFTETDTKI